jgi:hypothetical protein
MFAVEQELSLPVSTTGPHGQREPISQVMMLLVGVTLASSAVQKTFTTLQVELAIKLKTFSF